MKQRLKLSDLAGNPKNPRAISDAKLQMLKKSLAEFGDLSGIVFNKRTGRLVGGHQRLRVLPGNAEIEMDTETHGHAIIDGDRFNYRVVDWDETKEKAANIAANKHGGEWDIPALNDWLLELDAANIDMDLTGFDADEIKGLMAPAFEPGSEEDQGKLDQKKPVIAQCPNCGECFDANENKPQD